MKSHGPLFVTNGLFESIQARHLLNGDALGLLFGRGLWERDRQDPAFHLGLHILGLTGCIGIQRQEQSRRQVYFGRKWKLQRPGEFPGTALTNDVAPVFFSI